MDNGESAATFETARDNICKKLDSLSFSMITRDVVIPADGREVASDGSVVVTYYHATAEERYPASVYKNRPRSLWLTRNNRMREGLSIGPALLQCPSGIPSIGDMLVGFSETAPPPKGAQAAAKRHSGLRYTSWTAGAKPLFEFARLFLSTEDLVIAPGNALRSKLKTSTPGGEDELYALILLVLLGEFGEFDPAKSTKLALRMSITNFVQDCSIRFNDPSIWRAFIQAFPSVIKTVPAPAEPKFIGFQPHSPPEPHLFGFQPHSPPELHLPGVQPSVSIPAVDTAPLLGKRPHLPGCDESALLKRHQVAIQQQQPGCGVPPSTAANAYAAIQYNVPDLAELNMEFFSGSRVNSAPPTADADMPMVASAAMCHFPPQPLHQPQQPVAFTPDLLASLSALHEACFGPPLPPQPIQPPPPSYPHPSDAAMYASSPPYSPTFAPRSPSPMQEFS